MLCVVDPTGSGKHKWVPLSIDPPPSSRPPPSRGGHPRDRDRYREGGGGERYGHREGGERYKERDSEHKDRDRDTYRYTNTHTLDLLRVLIFFWFVAVNISNFREGVKKSSSPIFFLFQREMEGREGPLPSPTSLLEPSDARV